MFKLKRQPVDVDFNPSQWEDPIVCHGGGGKSATAPAPVYTPPPAAPSAAEAVTQVDAVTPEEEMARQKEAIKKGAKSLQIPISSTTSTADGTVGTGTTTPTA